MTTKSRKTCSTEMALKWKKLGEARWQSTNGRYTIHYWSNGLHSYYEVLCSKFYLVNFTTLKQAKNAAQQDAYK